MDDMETQPMDMSIPDFDLQEAQLGSNIFPFLTDTLRYKTHDPLYENHVASHLAFMAYHITKATWCY